MKAYGPRPSRPRGPAPSTWPALPTAELLSLYERHFGPLDPKAKARLLEAAATREHGEGWLGMEGLAA